MLTTAFACSDVGRKRQRNEDRFGVDEQGGVYLVADGMGGHAAGGLAADLGVAAFLASLAGRAQALDSMRQALHAANAAIRERTERDGLLAGMGTTLSALWLAPASTRGAGERPRPATRSALWCHVGDSRIYLLRGGALHQLTEDHSLVAEMVRSGDLRPEEAREHSRRHVITRAVGVVAAVEPDVGCLQLQPRDRLLLCTDGISGSLEDAEIRRCLLEARALETAATWLLTLADQRGGEDNATVVLLDIG